MNRHLRNLCLLIFLLFFASSIGAAEVEKIIQQSGINYPDGFDINTVGEIRGVVREILRPNKGPVLLILNSRNDQYTVITAPSWYVEDINLTITEGEEVNIKGSKSLGRDGNLYIIAQEIRASERVFNLRGITGAPLWGGGRFNTGGKASPGGARGGGHGRR